MAELHTADPAKQLGLDHEARAEDSHAFGFPRRDLLLKRREDAHDGQRRQAGKLCLAEVRCDRWEGNQLRTRGFHSLREGCQIPGQSDAIAGSHKIEHTLRFRMDHHNIEGQAPRRVRLGQAAVVVDRGSNAEPADQAKTTTFAHRVKSKLLARGRARCCPGIEGRG